MANDDGAGNFKWKKGYKKGDKSASGDYGNCAGSAKRALAECDAPKLNPKRKPESIEELKPSKGMALSIAMVTNVAPRHGVSDSQLKFYTTKVGQAFGSCGETEGEEIPHDSTYKPVGDGRGPSTMNPPWPGGIFKLNIEGEACEYKCDGTNAGRLFCPKKEIACHEDSLKSKEEGMLRCNGYRLSHAVVYCDF